MKKNIILLFCLLSTNILFAQVRVVLLEQFTNSSCPSCAGASPTIYTYLNNNPARSIGVSYHTSFPYSNDSMYNENTTDANARVSYYNVSGVPNSVVDGNVFNGSTSTLNTTLNTTITNRSNITPKYDITNNVSLTLNNGLLTGSFLFTSTDSTNTAATLKAHIVIIEKNVLKSSYAASPGSNSQTSYGYVMRKMLPTASGTTLVNKAINGQDSISISWNLSKIKDINELRVVAFVQRQTTKEIFDAIAFTPNILTNLKTIEIKPEITLFPNPSNGNIVQLNSEKEFNNIIIKNILGKEILNIKSKIDINTYVINVENLEKSTYIVEIYKSGLLITVKKLIKN